jgi:natural product precursor
MKTIKGNNKLEFSKNSVIELNDNNLHEVKGGSTWACSIGGSILLTIATYVDKIFVTAVQY